VEAELFHAEGRTVEPDGETDGQSSYVTLMYDLVTMVAFQKKEVLHIMTVCL